MKIETERLELVPLTADQLEQWVYAPDVLQKELNAVYQAEPLEGIFREIVIGQLHATKADPEQYWWHSFWMLIRKSDRVIVGSADFKDAPDQWGQVEIGYGLGKPFEHHGYMTEAVKAMCMWASCQPNIRWILAETDLSGDASGCILRRCGFYEISRGETIWWRWPAHNRQ